MKLFIAISSLVLFGFSLSAIADDMSYFSCKVREKISNGRTKTVTVRFVVEDLDMWNDSANLGTYPDTDEDMGPILVTPTEIDGRYPMMSNLNSQGGDLRIVDNHHLKLWGDGDGYQFTDLVIWDVDDSEDEDELEGYVRDYGPAYHDADRPSPVGFKSFIKCKRSASVL